jgi:hypothetical protein
MPKMFPPPMPALANMLAGFDPYRDNKPLRLNDSVTFERAQTRLRQATPGGRNRALYNAAFIGGKGVRDKLITEFEVTRQLLSTALDIGLTRIEAVATIKSGLQDGQRA